MSAIARGTRYTVKPTVSRSALQTSGRSNMAKAESNLWEKLNPSPWITAYISTPTKQYLDPYSRVCTAKSRDADRLTDRLTVTDAYAT